MAMLLVHVLPVAVLWPQPRGPAPVLSPTLRMQAVLPESMQVEPPPAPLPDLVMPRPVAVTAVAPLVILAADELDEPVIAATAAAPAPMESTEGEVDSPLTPPRFDAAYLDNPQPAYPLLSRRRQEAGIVLVRVRVSASGAALQVQVEHSSGFPRLDDAAMAAVRSWRFIPARRGDANVEAWVVVPVEFSLW